MSNEQSMPDELKLPADLAACEARLAASALPAPPLNRDELMYRAGWAAAVAVRSRETLQPSKPQPPARKRDVAFWSATSAALAASLAVAVTLAMTRRDETPTSAPAAGSRPPLAELAATTPEPPAHLTPQLARRESSALDAALRWNGRAPAASVWAAISNSRNSRWDEPIITPTSVQQPSSSPVSTATPPSWKQLRSLQSGDSI